MITLDYKHKNILIRWNLHFLALQEHLNNLITVLFFKPLIFGHSRDDLQFDSEAAKPQSNTLYSIWSFKKKHEYWYSKALIDHNGQRIIE